MTAEVTCDRCGGSAPVTRTDYDKGIPGWLSPAWATGAARSLYTLVTAAAAETFTTVDGRDLCTDCVKVVRQVMQPLATTG